MGKSATAKQQVVEYLMSVHLGVGYSFDKLRKVTINEKVAWQGTSDTLEAIQVDEPNLYGGPTKEGGVRGFITHLPGRPDQVLPDWVAARFNRTADRCPSFRGITTLFFSGGDAIARGAASQDGTAGDSVTPASSGGFSWSFNNPAIAQSIWVTGTRAPDATVTGLDPTHALIGLGDAPDANPAHMIAECLTNAQWGMGEPPSALNVTSFNAAALTLYNESFGLSVKWTRSAKVEDFIAEILDHIQGMVFLNPATGLWDLVLLRDDYDVETLPVIDETNGKVRNFARRLWGEAGNQVVVTWTDPTNEQDASITAEDLAAINSQGGSPIPIPRNYYMIRNAGLAFLVAKRDVRAASAPLASATIEVNRSQWKLTPGSVVVANFPKKKINNVVMRVMGIGRGKPGAGTIKLNLLEDIFSLDHASTAVPQTSEWVDPGVPPAPMDAVEIITLPAYFSLSADLQTAPVDLQYPEVLAAVLGYTENLDARSYGLFGETPDALGGMVFKERGAKSIVERTLHPAGLAFTGGTSRIAGTLVEDQVRGPYIGGFAFIGSGGDAGMEIAQVTDYDQATNEWILQRGLLDTVPQAWPANTPIWWVNKGYRIVDEKVLHADGETVDFKLCPRTSKGVLALADAATQSATLTARPHLPLRPANVKVNGFVTGPWGIPEDVASIDITWATRNRTLEDGQVVAWNAGPIAPEYEQETVVTIRDQTGTVVYEQSGLWTENSLSLPRDWLNRYTSATIQVSSRRRKFDSLQSHVFEIVGLPGDAGAPAPPTPPARTPPPSPDAAPADGAFTVTGSQFTLDGDGHALGALPAILVSGTRDRETAIGLIVRYHKVVEGQAEADYDWITLPQVALNDQPVQAGTTAVAPQTEYGVQIAYVSDKNILSEWGDLGNVTTGQVVAQMLEDLTASEIRSLLQETNDTIQAVSDAEAQLSNDVIAIQQQANDLIDTTKDHSDALLQIIMRLIETKAYFDPLLFSGNTPVKKVIDQEITDRQDGDTAILTVVDLIGLVTDDQTAFIANQDTFKISPTESLVDRLTLIQSSFETVTASITTESTTRATADTAFAQTVALIGAENAGHTAFVLNTSTVQIGGGVTMASRLSSLSAADSTNAANITSEQSARISGDNANASSISSLTATVGANTSAITTEQTARANGDSANATAISSLTTTVNGNTASITTLTSSVNGVLARYGVLLDVNGHVTGFVQNNNGLTGDFSIIADKFAIIDPSNPGTKIVPFSVVSGFANFANPVSVHKASTSSKLVMGPGFGASSDLVMWYGPDATGIASATVANSYFSLDVAGNVKTPDSVARFSIATDHVSCSFTGAGTGHVTTINNNPTISYTGNQGSVTISWAVADPAVEPSNPTGFTTGFTYTGGSGLSVGETKFGTATATVTDGGSGQQRQLNIAYHFTNAT